MSEERANVLEAIERIILAWKDKDVDTLRTMYTDDVTMAKADGLFRRGIDEEIRTLEEIRATGTIDLKYADGEVKLFGNVAVYNGRYTYYGDGNRVFRTGRGMFVFIKDGDTGEWKVTSGMKTKN